jgi:AraC family transcriptional regulator
VLDHIDEHLDDDLDVERLSGVAAFSKFHFHRQFSELFGIAVHKYVKLVRLKRASYQLAFRARERIIDIALASGYESHEAFARAFKKTIGQTPTEFREQPEWGPWHTTYQRLTELRSRFMKTDHRREDVKLVEFPSTRVAALEHHGPGAQIGDTVRIFIDWRRQNQLSPKVSATFNILYHDPNGPPGEYHLDICAATERGVPQNALGIVEKIIPGGRCAVLRLVGSDDGLGEAIHYLYSSWLPGSGEELRDFPLYLQRVKFFPDVPEHEQVLDIFLPVV